VGYLAGTLDIVTDQYAELTRAWPLATNETPRHGVTGLDVDHARLRYADSRGTQHDIPVTYTEAASDFANGDVTGIFAVDSDGTTMTVSGTFSFDVRVVPSTGDADAWYLWQGQLTVRQRSTPA